MESLNAAEGTPNLSFEDLTNLISKVISDNREILSVVFAEVAAGYGEGFGGHTLEGLFSADNFSRFFDKDKVTDDEWGAQQVREIYRLGDGLNSTADDVAKSQIARELIDYLVNV
jgi:Zn-dependent oligopeptidase